MCSMRLWYVQIGVLLPGCVDPFIPVGVIPLRLVGVTLPGFVAPPAVLLTLELGVRRWFRNFSSRRHLARRLLSRKKIDVLDFNKVTQCVECKWVCVRCALCTGNRKKQQQLHTWTILVFELLVIEFLLQAFHVQIHQDNEYVRILFPGYRFVRL